MSASDPERPDSTGLESHLAAVVGPEVFGEQLPVAVAYAELLTGRATQWGLLGPREGVRVWSRHLLNSAALAALVGRDRTVADVGSGAGLPGIPLAIARPDLQLTLIESLDRRARFLRLAVAELGLDDRVEVVHTRAEKVSGHYDVVVSRAVAPLPTLIPWCLGLVGSPGEVLAMRGSRVDEEILDYAATPGARSRAEVVLSPSPGDSEPIRVIRIAT